MPTNILRKSSERTPAGSGRRAPAAGRQIVIEVAGVTLHAQLADTVTADRLWAALPLFSHAETWGDSVHFALPVHGGRERGARINGRAGDLYYWSEDERIIIPFGPTPISRPDEMRLPRPCNVLAATPDDVTTLAVVTPGEKVTIRRA